MRSVLLTGITTPLGRKLALMLAENLRARVLGIGIEEAPHGFGSSRIEYARVNLRRPRQARNLLYGKALEHEVDTIVHLAMHRDARQEGASVRKLNVEFTRLVVELAEDHPSIRQVVFRSYAEVYRRRFDSPSVPRETSPLELHSKAPQWLRDRVEADLSVCAQMGLGKLSVTVLRCAETPRAECGSQLYDYLSGRYCLRPLGFDPLLNVLSVEDAARALFLAVDKQKSGVFNVLGYDTLALSELIELFGATQVPVPGPLIGPYYRALGALGTRSFRYEANRWRFHFGGMMDGSRAREELGYVPEVSVFRPDPGE